MTDNAADKAPDHPPYEPPSPCINICSIDPASGYCRGCLRTLDEISSWPGLDAAAKRRLLAALAGRRS